LKVKDVQTPQIVFEYNAKGEDWSGFEVAVEKSSIKERNQILNVVRSQRESAAREQKIREMTDIYTEIADLILPPLRRAEFAITCNRNNYTDDEIVQLALSAPYKLTANEKMYAAALNDDIDQKETIYLDIITDEASQNDWRAYNNLGILAIYDYLRTDEEANFEIAENYLDKANAISPNNGIILNNMGILYFLDGKKEEAKKAFQSSQKAQIEPVTQSYNLGLYKILDGDYAGAIEAMGNRSCDYGVALAQLLSKNYSAAKTSLECLQPKDAKAYYLLAIISARQNNVKEMLSHLAQAIEWDNSYKKEAFKDPEFKKFRNNPDFKNLVCFIEVKITE